MRKIRKAKKSIRYIVILAVVLAIGACGKEQFLPKLDPEEAYADIDSYSLSYVEDLSDMSVFDETDASDAAEEMAEILNDQIEEAAAETVTADDVTPVITENAAPVTIDDIPEYSGEDVIMINQNVPYFTEEEQNLPAGTIRLSSLDALGRCGANIMVAGPETLPQEEREEIGMVKPSGWHNVKYPEVIPDKYLYNRSHLLGFQLSGLNAEEENLITGTRYFNATLMLEYENIIADYIHDTGNHVVYRVTPVFKDDELVARGVLMEAYSVEDAGAEFCVFCYNVQPGVEIDYKTGESRLKG